jgi:hypothetical protein
MTLDLPSRAAPPLSPAVEVLLAHERAIVPQPEPVRQRALARAREALLPAKVVRYTPRAAWSPVRRLLFGAAAGVSLMAGAAAAYQMLRRPEPPQPAGPEATRAVRPASVAPPSREPAPQPIPAPEATPGPAPEASRRATASGKPDAPPEELRLLVRARRANTRGDYLGVLAIAAEHERRHPTGRLSEEREALRIKALVGLKRGSEARQVAGKFRRQFPRSVLLHKIDDMLASLR